MVLTINHPSWEGKLDEKFILEITDMSELSKIEELQICDVGLTEDDLDPDVFNQMVSLVELNLSGNNLTKIPEKISLSQLKFLNISKNNVEDVEWLSEFPNLIDLDIFENMSLTVDDKYKIMFLLENLQFLDGKRIQGRDKIGAIFTKSLLTRMEKLWNSNFAHNIDNESVLEDFTKMAQEKILIGPCSLKGYRLWRIKSLAEKMFQLQCENPTHKLSVSLSDDEAKKSPSPKKRKLSLDKKEKSMPLIECDYFPSGFLQCHSKSEGSKDFTTQVWCCVFEPDLANPELTTNCAATCGGEVVCVVDCDTTKINSRFHQANEEFYTLAWTTFKINNKMSNILVAAGCLGFVHLIYPNQAICYGRIKAHSSAIQALRFSPSSPTHLLTADKLGHIYLIDIGMVTVPDYSFAWKKLASFEGLDAAPLKLLVVNHNYLLSATEFGLFCWKTDFQKEFSVAKKSGKGHRLIQVECEIEFPEITHDDPVVDSLEMLSEDIIATKCAQEGVIFVWKFSDVLERIQEIKKIGLKNKITATLLAELKWSITKQCYINIATCPSQSTVMAGDEDGKVWLYDLKTLLKTKKSRPFQKSRKMHEDSIHCPLHVTFPTSIIPFPTCIGVNGLEIPEFKSGVLYNDIACSSDMKYIVVATNNNVVAIFKRKE